MPRKPTEKQVRELVQRQREAAELEKLREQINGWTAGGWAERVNYGPACTCGLKAGSEPCRRHPGGRTASYPFGGRESIETPVGEVHLGGNIRHYCSLCGTVRRALPVPGATDEWTIPPHRRPEGETWGTCGGGPIDYVKDRAP